MRAHTLKACVCLDSAVPRHVKSDRSKRDFSNSQRAEISGKRSKQGKMKSWQMSFSFSFSRSRSKFEVKRHDVRRQYALKADGSLALILHRTPHCSRQARKSETGPGVPAKAQVLNHRRPRGHFSCFIMHLRRRNCTPANSKTRLRGSIWSDANGKTCETCGTKTAQTNGAI